MALIVLPLATGQTGVDEGVQDVVEELLTTLLHGGGSATRQPACAVPVDREPWQAGERHALVGRGSVFLPEPADDQRQAGVGGALGRSLVAALRHPAMLAASGDGGAESALCVVPVLVVDDPMLSDQAIVERLAALSDVATWLHQAVELVRPGAARDGLRRQLLLFPWIFLPRLPPPDLLPDALFSVADRVSRARSFPLVHAATGRQEQVRAWEGYGQARLLADLYVLHALSASKAELLRFFPLGVGSRTQRRLYLGHSALVEYPLEEHQRHRGLAALISARGKRAAFLPGAERIDQLVAECGPAVADRVRAAAERLEQVVGGDVLDPAELAFSDPPAQGDPDFRFVDRDGTPSPRADRWQRWVRDDQWPVAGAPRRAPRLHDDTAVALRQRVRRGLHQDLGKALAEARVRLDEELARTEQELGACLEPDPSAEGVEGWSSLSLGLGRALAMAEGIGQALAAIENDKQRPEDIDAVVEEFDGTRYAWIAAEERLLEQGMALPSAGGLYLEVLAAAVVVPVIGGVGMALHRKRQLGQHFEAWRMLGDDLRRRANQATARLAGIVNDRAREARRHAVHDPASALRAGRDRFAVEVRGLLSLVQDEHVLLARKQARRPPAEVARQAGRFSIDPELPPLPPGLREVEKLQEDLAALLRRALCLTEMPDRVAVGEYQVAIDRFVQRTAEGERSRAPPTELVEQAATYGLDALRVAAFSGYGQARMQGAGGLHLVVAGQWIDQRLVGFDWEGLNDRVDGDLRLYRGGGEAGQVAVSASAAPEVAVFFTVVPVRVDPNPGQARG